MLCVGKRQNCHRFGPSGIRFVNFYKAYRNSSRDWIQKFLPLILPLVNQAAELKNDVEAREIAKAVDNLPKIPKPNNQRGEIAASSLLTPLFACLDPRLRFPVINKAKHVEELHRKLGITAYSLSDKLDTLVRLINQQGIKDALMLDVCSQDIAEKPSPKPSKRARQSVKGRRPLDEKDVDEVTVSRKAGSKRLVRLHNEMTNRLRDQCETAGGEKFQHPSAFETRGWSAL